MPTLPNRLIEAGREPGGYALVETRLAFWWLGLEVEEA